MDGLDVALRDYIEHEIIPRYDSFDAAHRRDHVQTVIERSMSLAQSYNLDVNMVYAIAAYHDTGLICGREKHHIESARIVREDRCLRRWFSDAKIEIIADAVEDHRASSKHEPRTIYGRIVAEADRVIDVETILRRTIQYTLANHTSLGREEGYKRMVDHLHEKYDYGGYLRLWIEESDNALHLEQLRQLIADKERLYREYIRIYTNEVESR